MDNKKVEDVDNIRSNKRQSLSLFGIDLSSSRITNENKSTYEIQLESELESWKKLLSDEKNELKKNQTIKSYDVSCLKPDQKVFIDTAPNFQQFIDESIAYQQKCTAFINNMQLCIKEKENFNEQIVQRLESIQNNLIESEFKTSF